jgi:hypothetical protein
MQTFNHDQSNDLEAFLMRCLKVARSVTNCAENEEPPVLVKEKQFSRISGKSISVLQRERWEGGGTPYIKENRSVFYDWRACMIRLFERQRMSTTDSAA